MLQRAGPAQQLEWPPRDEFVPTRRRRARRSLAAQSPFTYGDGLNPALATNPTTVESRTAESAHRPDAAMRRRRPVERDPAEEDSASSYDSTTTPGSSSDEDDGGALSVDHDEDDDVPLGQLAARRARTAAAHVGMGACVEDVDMDEAVGDDDLAPERSVRIRRGSEGYEIRPRRAWAVAESGNSDVSDDWQQVEPEESERERDTKVLT